MIAEELACSMRELAEIGLRCKAPYWHGALLGLDLQCWSTKGARIPRLRLAGAYAAMFCDPWSASQVEKEGAVADHPCWAVRLGGGSDGGDTQA